MENLESLRKLTIFPQGSTTEQELPYLEKTRADLAQHPGKPLEFVDQLNDGQIAVDETLVQQLKALSGLDTGYWLNKEKRYRSSFAAYGASLNMSN